MSKDAADGYLGERAVLSRLLGSRRPLGSERLAVAAPWRVKFDERKLPDASDGSAAAAGMALVAVVERRGGSSRHLLRSDPVVKVVRREDSDAVFELHGGGGGEGEEERQHRDRIGRGLGEVVWRRERAQRHVRRGLAARGAPAARADGCRAAARGAAPRLPSLRPPAARPMPAASLVL